MNGRALAVAALIIGGVILLGRKIVLSAREAKFFPAVQAAADKWRVPVAVIAALVQVESRWDPNPNDPDMSDAGLIQIHRNLFRAYRPDLIGQFPRILIERPELGLDLGARLVRELLDHGVPVGPELFSAWNTGETKYRDGVRSPYVSRYVTAYNDYLSRGVA